MIGSLTELKITGDYLRRIGAEPVHFHLATISAMVNGYPKVIGRVRFTEEGATHCWGTAEPPNEAEAAGIAAEFASTEFPRIISIAAISDPPPGCDLSSPNTFICHDFNDQIIMVHQRYETQSGGKGFLPWTRWSDGQWRRMEPDTMPFYGLKGASEHSTLFIHEGSKAARRVKAMLAGEEEVGRFPWLEEVRWGAHIGWIGGVHALHRSDWRKLASMNWKKVIVVCDNDDGGRAILPDISEHFRCPTFGLVFTDHWPEAFDLGDDWPESLFSDDGQYIGPGFQQCLQPATFATDETIIPAEGNGKPTRIYEIRPEFAEQWAWVESADMMVNLVMPQYRMASGHFNQFIRPFSHVKTTIDLFHKRYSGNKMQLTYDPSQKGTVVRNAEGLQCINLYSPSPIRPSPGDWGPWDGLLEHLFPKEKDRALVKRWAATLIAKPETRMIFGLLLMSTNQGVGKGTFARIMASLVGRQNASFPSASLIVDSQFNGWVSGKRLIVVDEIYEGHSWKAYNKLKSYVTDEEIEVNVKHEKTWTMPNWTHYILMSNSQAALKIENKDRRWLVPEVSEEGWPEDRWNEFYGWMRGGGLSCIAQWAKTYESRGEGRYVRPGEIAPVTERKRLLIEESKNDVERMIDDVGEAIEEYGQPVAVPISSFRDWIEGKTRKQMFETPQNIGRTVRQRGLWVTDRVKIGGTKERLVVNNEEMIKWEATKLRSALKLAAALMDDGTM